MTDDGEKKSLKFYGMSSREAQEKHHEGVKDYCAAEGKCVEVAYKGPVQGVLQEVTGRSEIGLCLRRGGSAQGSFQVLHLRPLHPHAPPNSTESRWASVRRYQTWLASVVASASRWHACVAASSAL